MLFDSPKKTLECHSDSEESIFSLGKTILICHSERQ